MSEINFDSNKLREEKEKKKAFARRAKEARVNKNWKEALELPCVKLILGEILNESKPFCSPYGIDPNLTHINIGKGDIGRYILTRIEVSRPQSLVEIMRETNADRVRDEMIERDIEDTKET